MRRRDVITGIASVAVAETLAPFAANAQPAPPRRLAVMMATGQTDEYVAALDAFKQAVAALGWRQGNNLTIDVRWAAGREPRVAADEVAAKHPDVVLAQSEAVVSAVLAATTAPIVFVHIADPIASGLSTSLAHPSGRTTGITNTMPTLAGKWLQLLKEMVPPLQQVAMLMDPEARDRGAIFFDPFEAAARSLGVAPLKAVVQDWSAIDVAMTDLARRAGSGVIVTPAALFAGMSKDIIAASARLKLPAAYPYRYYVEQGGLLSYGVNNIDLFRQVAPYVDRLLKGAQPAELPIQQPTRFELLINRTTARALGAKLTTTLLAEADQVIE